LTARSDCRKKLCAAVTKSPPRARCCGEVL
jgi:hypothetical protein